MSGTFKFKRFYSEGVAAEHPDVAGQKEFANRADAEITRRRKERAKKGGPQLPGFVASVKKEEVELGEEKRPYPFKRVEAQTERARKGSVYGRGRDNNSPISDSEMEATRRVNKMSIVSAAETRKKQKADRNEEFELDEKIDVGADVSKTISDFVHSKNKTFKGDSKKQRINRALGAYYGAQKEENEMKGKDPCWKNYKMVGTKKKGSKTVANCVPEEIDYTDAYDFVIETLIECQFVEDVNSAERMYDALSEDFVSVILEEYIEEKARGTRPKKTVHAYDVDETLFSHGKKGKPNVKVHVKDESGKRVKSLSNQEFNTHKLDKGHSYDFSEFQSAKKFKETSSPNKKVIKDIKRKQARGQNVHVITARSKFDKPKEFHGHLKKHGVDVPMNKIHYTGGMKGGDIGKKKVDVANAVAKKSGAKKTHMYDDAAKVHKAFEAEKKNKPTSKKIKTHMVAPDKKTGESKVRSYQATKEQFDMTPYEYWKQYIA